mgnify:FL=1
MQTRDLEKIDVKSLRRMARASGLPLNRKIDIVNALADDSVGLVYRSADRLKTLVREVLAEDGVLYAKNGNSSSSPVGVAIPEDDDTFIRWPEVSPAVCDVNGEYVFPPFYEELKAVSKFSHVELKGPAGSGKTLAVHKLAELNKRSWQLSRLMVDYAEGT